MTNYVQEHFFQNTTETSALLRQWLQPELTSIWSLKCFLVVLTNLFLHSGGKMADLDIG